MDKIEEMILNSFPQKLKENIDISIFNANYVP
jgi:hypothetical protein